MGHANDQSMYFLCLWLHYNQEKKLVLQRYLLHFSMRLCGLVLFCDFIHNFLPKKYKNTLKSSIHQFWLLTLSSTFSNFWILSENQNLGLMLCSKQQKKINLLYLIVVPQLSGGWFHNYSTKTRQASHGNEQSMYSFIVYVLHKERAWIR